MLIVPQHLRPLDPTAGIDADQGCNIKAVRRNVLEQAINRHDG
jgi:hypothetical protein